ncbi:MAG: hypothetical protein HW405_584 [Candidatus Berkelbacteria bacterium]|nr:hypothetical protein [Candidatus Berkelbacteria bacterium]
MGEDLQEEGQTGVDGVKPKDFKAPEIGGFEPEEKPEGQKMVERAMAEGEAEMSSEQIAGFNHGETMAFAVKDIMDISAAIRKQAETAEKALRESPSTEGRMQTVREETKDQPFPKQLHAIIQAEHSRAIEELQAGRLRNISELYRHIADRHVEHMTAVLREAEERNLSSEETNKKLGHKALVAKISGKYWQLYYGIHGSNIPDMPRVTDMKIIEF